MIKNWVIESYRSVGPIELGQARAAVRRSLGQPTKSFLKTPSAELLTDEWRDLGVFVFYRIPDNCAAVEFVGPIKPTLDEQNLLGIALSEARLVLSRRDAALLADEVSVTSLKCGIGLFASSAGDNPEEPVESVIVFERGYYDS